MKTKTRTPDAALPRRIEKTVHGDFRHPEIAKLWLESTGTYGEFFRTRIINPMVAGILEHLRTADPARTRLSREPVLLDALATCAHGSWMANGQGAAAWHARWPQRSESPMKIIDLGCGEGYRGRWLARMGFEYCGVDYSSVLIAAGRRLAAKERFTTPPVFEVLDLSSEMVEDSLRPLAEAPVQLFLGVTVLDHLDDKSVERLISSLSRLGCRSARSYLFVATCNPHYYRALVKHGRGEPANVAIESLCQIAGKKVEVTIYKRSRSYYRELFHRAGVLVLEQATPIAIETPSQGIGDFDHGTGPFHCWLIQLHGRQWDEIQMRGALDSIPDGNVGKRVLNELAKIGETAIPIMRVQKGEPVVAAGSLGGDLLILISGKCHLSTGDANLPRLPFLPGEVFGDLELGTSYESTEPARYRRAILADEVCVVGVVRRALIKQVLPGTSTEAEMLRLLRSRLQSQVWLMDAKSGAFNLHGTVRKKKGLRVLGELTSVSDSVAQTTHYLAACLVGALERQRDGFPELGSTLLLQDVGKNVKSIGHVDPETITTAIELLVCAGVVYAANLTYAHRRHTDIHALYDRYSDAKGEQAELWGLYSYHLEEQRNSPSLPTFFFVEDEWALRYLGSRPDFSSTKLLDNLLFLNGHGLTSLIGWTEFAKRSAMNEAGPTFPHRLDRFMSEVRRYVSVAMDRGHDRDSLGFLLAPPGKRRAASWD